MDMSEAKRKANTDTSYCINEKCKEKCWRHESNYEFDEKENYCFMQYCQDYMKYCADLVQEGDVNNA